MSFSSGSIIPTIALFVVGFLDEDSKALSVIMIMLPNCADAALYGGNYMTHVDISPNYAGVIMGVSNFIPNFCNILAPLFVQFVVTDEVSQPKLYINISIMFSTSLYCKEFTFF